MVGIEEDSHGRFALDRRNHHILGWYETETRALQVLDEIHARIASGTIEAHEGEAGTWRKVEKYGVVYIMPES